MPGRRSITEKPIVAVFNTHVHGDHWLGNQAVKAAWPDVAIYGHPNMLALIEQGEGKAWVDMIARARLTFRYTESGPVGLLEGKKAYVVIASGGVPVDSPVDFATPYLRHALGFVGITDVDIIAADRINIRGDEALDEARVRIADLIHMNPLRDASAA